MQDSDSGMTTGGSTDFARSRAACSSTAAVVLWAMAFILASISVSTSEDAVRDITAGASVFLFLIGAWYLSGERSAEPGSGEEDYVGYSGAHDVTSRGLLLGRELSRKDILRGGRVQADARTVARYPMETAMELSRTAKREASCRIAVWCAAFLAAEVAFFFTDATSGIIVLGALCIASERLCCALCRAGDTDPAGRSFGP